MIAMAMSCNPEVLIADEPTTALDVTVQAQVLEQLNKLQQDLDTGAHLITHNLGVVARYADSVKIRVRRQDRGGWQRDGRVPKTRHHPYTLGLIRAVPRLDLPAATDCIPSRVSRPICPRSAPTAARSICAVSMPMRNAPPAGRSWSRWAKATTAPVSTEISWMRSEEEVLHA